MCGDRTPSLRHPCTLFDSCPHTITKISPWHPHAIPTPSPCHAYAVPSRRDHPHRIPIPIPIPSRRGRCLPYAGCCQRALPRLARGGAGARAGACTLPKLDKRRILGYSSSAAFRQLRRSGCQDRTQLKQSSLCSLGLIVLFLIYIVALAAATPWSQSNRTGFEPQNVGVKSF